MPKLIEVNDGNFESTVQRRSLVMIEFWLIDCPLCKVITPIVEEIAADNEEKIFVGAIRADENPRTVKRFEISNVPTLLIMKDGREIDRITFDITPTDERNHN